MADTNGTQDRDIAILGTTWFRTGPHMQSDLIMRSVIHHLLLWLTLKLYGFVPWAWDLFCIFSSCLSEAEVCKQLLYQIRAPQAKILMFLHSEMTISIAKSIENSVQIQKIPPPADPTNKYQHPKIWSYEHKISLMNIKIRTPPPTPPSTKVTQNFSYPNFLKFITPMVLTSDPKSEAVVI